MYVVRNATRHATSCAQGRDRVRQAQFYAIRELEKQMEQLQGAVRLLKMAVLSVP